MDISQQILTLQPVDRKLESSCATLRKDNDLMYCVSVVKGVNMHFKITTPYTIMQDKLKYTLIEQPLC